MLIEMRDVDHMGAPMEITIGQMLIDNLDGHKYMTNLGGK